MLMRTVEGRAVLGERGVRALVIVALLLAAAYLGMHATTTYLIALLAAGAGLVLLRKLELGFVALLVSALSLPFALGTGTQTEVPLAFLLVPLLFAAWLLRTLGEKRLALAGARVTLPLAVFVASSLISFLSGNLPWNYFATTAGLPAQLGGLAIFVFSALLLFVTAHQITDVRWLKLLCAILLCAGVVGIAIRVLPQADPLTSRLLVDRATGSMFWVWVLALAAGLALFNRDLAMRWRVCLIALALATLAAEWLFARAWTSGWVPPLVALITLVWLRSPRLGAVLTALGLVALNIQYPALLGNLLELKAYSIDTRIVAWQIMLENVIPLNPVLGLGPANYYFYTPLSLILGYYISFNSHNQYVDIVAQTGLVGLAALAWLMLALARVGWRLRKRVGIGFERGYVYACLAGLAGTLWAGMHGDWFLPFVYNIGIEGFRASLLPWLFLGGLLAIARMQPAAEAGV